MTFNKILLVIPVAASVMAMKCTAMEWSNAEEELLAKIPDVSKILPPIGQYVAKMRGVVERYKNVYKEMSETYAELRIKNAKRKALDFYSGIFGVNPSEVEEYSKNFTTAQYLAWVAKEPINGGDYTFAKNENELFDSCADYVKYGGEFFGAYNFYRDLQKKIPSKEEIVRYMQVFVPYNSPYFESFIVHETGHVLDLAYRILFDRGETIDISSGMNQIMCEDAVSVFFETMYTIKNDPTFMIHRLTDLYGISFKQQYMEQIKTLGIQNRKLPKEMCNDVSNLPYVEDYSPAKYFGKVTSEQFMENIAKEHPELSFIYDSWKKQVVEWSLMDFPTSLSARADDIASDLNTILNVYKTGNMGIDLSKIFSYAQYVPHVYRTLNMFDNLESSKSVLDALYKIVSNVPEIMTEEELKIFVKRLDF